MEIFKKDQLPPRNSDNQMRKIFLFAICTLLLSNAFAVRECVYDPRGFTFHCSNNMPGSEIGPGQSGNITITCCFTERSFMDSNKTLPINVEVKGHWFHRVQNPDGSWVEHNETYPASKWITNVTYPESAKGFESFPVTITYELPEESPEYKAGAVLPSRVDIQVNMETGVVPNNAVYPQIRIPSNWESNDLFNQLITGLMSLDPVVAGGGAGMLLFSVVAFGLVKRKRKKQRMKQVMQPRPPQGQRPM